MANEKYIPDQFDPSHPDRPTAIRLSDIEAYGQRVEAEKQAEEAMRIAHEQAEQEAAEREAMRREFEEVSTSELTEFLKGYELLGSEDEMPAYVRLRQGVATEILEERRREETVRIAREQMKEAKRKEELEFFRKMNERAQLQREATQREIDRITRESGEIPVAENPTYHESENHNVPKAALVREEKPATGKASDQVPEKQHISEVMSSDVLDTPPSDDESLKDLANEGLLGDDVLLALQHAKSNEPAQKEMNGAPQAAVPPRPKRGPVGAHPRMSRPVPQEVSLVSAEQKDEVDAPETMLSGVVVAKEAPRKRAAKKEVREALSQLEADTDKTPEDVVAMLTNQGKAKNKNKNKNKAERKGMNLPAVHMSDGMKDVLQKINNASPKKKAIGAGAVLATGAAALFGGGAIFGDKNIEGVVSSPIEQCADDKDAEPVVSLVTKGSMDASIEMEVIQQGDKNKVYEITDDKGEPQSIKAKVAEVAILACTDNFDRAVTFDGTKVTIDRNDINIFVATDSSQAGIDAYPLNHATGEKMYKGKVSNEVYTYIEAAFSPDGAYLPTLKHNAATLFTEKALDDDANRDALFSAVDKSLTETVLDQSGVANYAAENDLKVEDIEVQLTGRDAFSSMKLYNKEEKLASDAPIGFVRGATPEVTNFSFAINDEEKEAADKSEYEKAKTEVKKETEGN